MTEPTDPDLLSSWRDGDNAAGNELVERHAEALYAFFANKAPAEVEDLSQQTLTACLEAAQRYDPARPFRVYLLGIARRVLYKHLREVYRRDPDEIDDLTVASTETSPSRAAALSEERQVLLYALRRIPLKYQVTLELHYWQGLTTPEISVALEASEGTIRSQLTRGRALLRDQIAALAAPAALLESTLSSLDAWSRSIR